MASNLLSKRYHPRRTCPKQRPRHAPKAPQEPHRPIGGSGGGNAETPIQPRYTRRPPCEKAVSLGLARRSPEQQQQLATSSTQTTQREGCSAGKPSSSKAKTIMWPPLEMRRPQVDTLKRPLHTKVAPNPLGHGAQPSGISEIRCHRKSPWTFSDCTRQKQRHFRKNKTKKHKNPDPMGVSRCPPVPGTDSTFPAAAIWADPR